MPKFKVDENLPTEAAELLAGAGHDPVTVGDQRMIGEPDTNVAMVCQREERAVVTLDLGRKRGHSGHSTFLSGCAACVATITFPLERQLEFPVSGAGGGSPSDN